MQHLHFVLKFKQSVTATHVLRFWVNNERSPRYYHIFPQDPRMSFSYRDEGAQLHTGAPFRAIGGTYVECGDALYIAGGWPPKTATSLPPKAVGPASPAPKKANARTGAHTLRAGTSTFLSPGGSQRDAVLDTDRLLGRFTISKVRLTTAATQSPPRSPRIPASDDDFLEAAQFGQSAGASLPPVVRPPVPTLELARLLPKASPATTMRGPQPMGPASLIITNVEDRVGHVCVASAAFQKVLYFGGEATAFTRQGTLCDESATLLLDIPSSNCEPVRITFFCDRMRASSCRYCAVSVQIARGTLPRVAVPEKKQPATKAKAAAGGVKDTIRQAF